MSLDLQHIPTGPVAVLSCAPGIAEQWREAADGIKNPARPESEKIPWRAVVAVMSAACVLPQCDPHVLVALDEDDLLHCLCDDGVKPRVMIVTSAGVIRRRPNLFAGLDCARIADQQLPLYDKLHPTARKWTFPIAVATAATFAATAVHCYGVSTMSVEKNPPDWRGARLGSGKRTPERAAWERMAVMSLAQATGIPMTIHYTDAEAAHYYKRGLNEGAKTCSVTRA